MWPRTKLFSLLETSLEHHFHVLLLFFYFSHYFARLFFKLQQIRNEFRQIRICIHHLGHMHHNQYHRQLCSHLVKVQFWNYLSKWNRFKKLLWFFVLFWDEEKFQTKFYWNFIGTASKKSTNSRNVLSYLRALLLAIFARDFLQLIE